MSQILEFEKRKLTHRKDGAKFLKIPNAVKAAIESNETD